ncbi:hypothetical protein SGUI_2191 [Serinicoccus hydrothermalis]|uniref:Uncharacterized protein n=1 Tax=Serinicoccus hydrothermalis TaxID=1758689 RepID=A0A1B1NDR9_9MICO|nr:aldolase/citrate lyase family protein [Serinicoccus hydrothermalis]ANS79587.1 hypothetical protein SGUI_2191 [Serinicoccus hydrothermalis]
MSTGLEQLVAAVQAEADERLAAADADLARLYPGDPATRQPVHTVYVPADAFEQQTPWRWGAAALELMDDHLPDAAAVTRVTGMDAGLADEVLPRVRRKLAEQPVEDLRVDFEDGYGRRPDDVEDAHLGSAVEALRTYAGLDGAPSWYGIRIKCLERDYRHRGLRTLVDAVAGLASGAEVPPGLVLTLPKVTSTDQVEAMVAACARIEEALGLADRALGFEIQVETPQAILGADGRATVAPLVHASAGRCTGLHYGTFDYSAGLGIAAAHQTLEHPAADHAKATMQLAAAQTGVRCSDGSTNVIAFGTADDAASTWALHHRLVTRALERGYYQGWDMHPGHLPTRYLATYAFFRAALPASARRLRAYVDQAGGDVMDEPATARMLASAVLRGLHCGALDEDEVRSASGLDRDGLVALLR